MVTIASSQIQTLYRGATFCIFSLHTNMRKSKLLIWITWMHCYQTREYSVQCGFSSASAITNLNTILLLLITGNRVFSWVWTHWTTRWWDAAHLYVTRRNGRMEGHDRISLHQIRASSWTQAGLVHDKKNSSAYMTVGFEESTAWG